MAAPLIEAKGLTKTYNRPFSPLGLAMRGFDRAVSAFGRDFSRGLKAVEDLSFSVEAEGIVGFLGPNGAGKTTTLKMVMGFLQPSAGGVFLFGRELEGNHSMVFSRVGGLIDAPHFYDYLSGRANLELKALLYEGVSPERIEEVLSLLSLEKAAHRRVSTYSTGMKQRLGLASAILHEPELLVLDEPTRGLDPKGQAEIRSVLQKIRDQGRTTILLSSHLLHEVELICDAVVIIDQGKHLYTGPVDSLLQGEKELIRVVVDDEKAAAEVIKESEGLHLLESSGSKDNAVLTVSSKRGGAPSVAKALVEGGIALRELSPIRRSLEEFFLKLTAGGGNEPSEG